MSILIICKETDSYIYQVVSGEFHFAAACSEKNIPETFPLLATNNWIVLAVQWYVKYFFALNSLIIWKSRGEEDGMQTLKEFGDDLDVCILNLQII